MRLCKLGLFLLSLSVFVSFKTSALGLGEIKVNSTLNQPLDAEITLLQVRDLTKEEILVGLASSDDFRNLEIERGFFLSSLRFDVRLENSGGPVVKITSTEIVREPFLNFLIESQWPSGRVLREYTLLLDLPVYSAQAPSRVEAPQTVPTTTSPKIEQPETRPSQTVPSVGSAPIIRRPPTTSRVSGGTFGPVQANDTLWAIAQSVRPSDSYSIQQTMIAIQRLNPEAFINNNINLLRRGQVLRVPSESDLAELNETQAINEVAFQNTQWSGEASGAGLSANGGSSASGSRESSNQGRVSLGIGDGSSNDPENTSARGRSSQQASALQNELAITLEELDTSKRENTELKSRVVDLEQQIQTMERLIEVSSDELRALQLASQQNTNAEVTESSISEEAVAPVNTETVNASQVDPAEPSVTDPSEPVSVDQTSVEQPVTSQPAQTTPVPASNPTTSVSRPVPQKSIVDLIFDNIIYIAAGLVVLLLLVFLVVRKIQARRDEQEDDFVDSFEVSETDDEDSLPSEDQLDFDAPIEDQTVRLNQPEEGDYNDQSEEEHAEITEEALANVVPEEVIAEADIYIAYGKYDQAEEMLKRALQADPDNVDAQVKLLEVYSESGNLEKFDDRFHLIHTVGDNGAIVRGNQLRAQFADVAPFAAAGVAVAAGLGSLEAEAGQFDDVDFSALGDTDEASDGEDLLSELGEFENTESEASEFDLSSNSDNREDVGELDFDSFGLDDEASEVAAELNTESSDEEFSLDFGDDLEFDSLAEGLDEESSTPSKSDDLIVNDTESDDDFSFDLDLDFDEPNEESPISLESDSLSLNETDTAAELADLTMGDELGVSLNSEAESLDFDAFDETSTDDSTAVGSALDDDFDFENLNLDDDDSSDPIVDLSEDLLDTDLTLDSGLGDTELAPELEVDDVSEFDSLNLDDELAELDGTSNSLNSSLELSADLLEEESDLSNLDSSFDLNLPSESPNAETQSIETLDDLDLSESADSLEDSLNSLEEQPEDLTLDDDLDSIDLDADSMDFDESLLELDEDLNQPDVTETSVEEDLETSVSAPELETSGSSVDDSLPDLSTDDADLDDLNIDDTELSSGQLDDSMFDDIDNDLGFDEEGLDVADSEPVVSADVANADDEDPVSAALDQAHALDDSETELEDFPVLENELDSGLDVDDVSLDIKDLDEGLDLEALDKEMEALVGHSDDLDSAPTLEEVAGLDIDSGEEEAESEDFFNQAVSTSELEEPASSNQDSNVVELDNDMSFLTDGDESDTKLDLAKAYLDMGDADGARDILDEVLTDGNDKQRQEAESLLSNIPS